MLYHLIPGYVVLPLGFTLLLPTLLGKHQILLKWWVYQVPAAGKGRWGDLIVR